MKPVCFSTKKPKSTRAVCVACEGIFDTAVEGFTVTKDRLHICHDCACEIAKKFVRSL